MTSRRWWYVVGCCFISMSGVVGCACYAPYGPYGSSPCGPNGCPAPGQYRAPGTMPGSGTMPPVGAPMQPAPGSGFFGSGGF
ncbi:hypothetical protein GC176_02000 [bacterium]|nr:hypothetical protein [bacterium]